jgi:hypothetical protein
MTARTNIAGASNYVLQEAISAYSDEAYTNAKKLSGTAIVGDNPLIDTSTESFIGQVRWFKPLNPTINVASITDATDGTTTSYASDYLTYIKTLRTHGADKVNMQTVVTQQDGLAKMGRDFGETRAQDEHNAILSVLKGVALSEVLYGTSRAGGAVDGLGGQSFVNDPTSKNFGFYYDAGNTALMLAAGGASGSNAAITGAVRAETILQAFGTAFKDYEPDYAYLVISPKTMASFRSANLVDEDRITEGNMNFNSIFQGKLRLIVTRASAAFSAAELTKINTGTGVNLAGTDCSFVVLPGALAMKELSVPEPTEIYRDARKFKGGGATSVWNRWGYVLAPAGYNWAGNADAFPSDSNYFDVVEGGTQKVLTTATSTDACKGVWERKAASVLSLGILPIFHG